MTHTTVTAHVFRTKMIGGGTSYDVHFRKQDKPSYPLHRNGSYATVIRRDDGDYFDVCDAIAPKSQWDMELGWDKYDAHMRLERIANRLAVRIAARAFPELKGLRTLPTLWATWTLPSAHKTVRVRLALPE